MRRFTTWAAALSFMAVTATAAFAQVPADPNNPNENVPDAVPSRTVIRLGRPGRFW